MITATDHALGQEVTDALCTIGDCDFGAAAERLLSALGYRSERRLPMSGDVDDFIRTLPARNPNTQTERRFREHANSVKILFQITDSEIEASTNPTLFADTEFDTGNARSFLFAAVTLKGESYSRHLYAEFTREVNKRISVAPTVMLFRTASAALDRIRPSQKEQNTDEPTGARRCATDTRDRSHGPTPRPSRYFGRPVDRRPASMDGYARKAAQLRWTCSLHG